ncbi:MAG: hypothetical protein ABDI19_08640 [Armatimonadota bacterium]
MRLLLFVLGVMSGLSGAFAQAPQRADADALGLLLLYLVLVAVSLVGLILRREQAQAHIRAVRERSRVLFWRGFALTLAAVALTVLLGSLSDSLRKAGDERTAGVAGLIAALVALAYLLLVLLGFGSVVVVLGDAAAQLFGWRDLGAGWCAMLGSALFLLVVWIPVFGWALGIYWLSLMTGGLWERHIPQEGGAS